MQKFSFQKQLCSLSLRYNFFQFTSLSSKQEEMLWRCPRTRKTATSCPSSPAHLQVSECRSTSENLESLPRWPYPLTTQMGREAPQQDAENASTSWWKNNPRRFWPFLWWNEMGTGWTIGYKQWPLPPKWHLVKSNVYSKAFYHLVTKNLKINMRFLLNINGKKKKKIT